MKLVIRFVPVVMVAVLASTALGQGIIPGDPSTWPPAVSIVNTPHNLNNLPSVTIPGNRVCLPCHTPHNALLFGEENVLWNHAETGETFTMYSSSAGQPEGVSKKCLSCHDGVTAVDNYGASGTNDGYKITGAANLGNNLSNDHPIGIVYPTNDGGFNDPATFGPGYAGGAGVQLVTISSADRVECTSCHQPHNNGLGSFLRVPVLESYLCLQCHIK